MTATKKRWTAKDVREFDRIVRLCDSQRQMDRIIGRGKMRDLQGRFTKEELDEMWLRIKDKA